MKNKKLLITILFSFNLIYNFAQQWEQVGISVNGDSEGLGFIATINNNGTVFAASDSNFFLGPSKLPEVKAYEKSGSTWVQLGQTLKANNGNDFFGSSIHLAAQANRLAIGTPKKSVSGDMAVGSVEVFELSGDNWVLYGNELSLPVNENSNDLRGGFGSTVKLSNAGNFLIVGNPGNSDISIDQGKAFVYTIGSDGNWEPLGQELNGEELGDAFGANVDINGTGDIIAVGAVRNSDNNENGYVNVYKLINNAWVKLGDKINVDPTAGNTGKSIDLNFSGDRIVVGAFRYDGFRGKVKVYEFKNNNWVQLGQDLIGKETQSQLGAAVSINAYGNIIALGAFEDGAEAQGETTVYHLLNETWVPIGSSIEEEPTDAVRVANGFSVDLSADGYTVLSSSFRSNNEGTSAFPQEGQVRVFNFSPSNCDASFVNFQDTVTIPADDFNCDFATNVCLDQPETNTCIGMIVQNDAPSTLPLGDTVVNWSVFSATGLSETRQQTIKVKDLTPPEIITSGSIFVEILANEDSYIIPDYFSLGEVSVFDSCGISSLEQIPPAGSALTPGGYVITFVAKDYGDNQAIGELVLDITQQTLGVDDSFNNKAVSIVPNPAKDYFTILNASTNKLNALSIYDITGRVLKSMDLRQRIEDVEVNISELPRATYFVVISSDKGKIVKKIIVN